MSDRRNSGKGRTRTGGGAGNRTPRTTGSQKNTERRESRDNIRQMSAHTDRRRKAAGDGQNTGDAKRPKRFTVRMQKKLVVLFVFVLLAFAGLCVRLGWIITEDGERYTKQVLSQRGYDSQTIPYRRGDIVDAKGNILATSEKVYNLITDSTLILYDPKKSGETKYLEPTLEALGRYFGLDINEVRKFITENPNSAYKRWLRQLTYDQIKGFQEEMNAKDSMIKGVWFEEEYKRKYPYGTMASDVIGFAGTDNTGSYGLEEYYNDILNGTTGREYGYLNEESTLERKIKPAVDGYTIHSTIDANIQQIMEKYINQFIEEHRDAARTGDGAENVGAIVMEVDTGRILGMASSSQYDLNNPRDYNALLGNIMVEEFTNANGYTEIRKTGDVFTQDLLAQLTNSEVDEETRTANERKLYVNLNYLWKNFCISDTYEPGSTAKPFTVAAALEAGAITGNEWYTCSGSIIRGGHAIKCHGGNGHGSVNVQNAVAWSCNMALIQIAETLGIDKFVEFQKTFNFGLKTNVGRPEPLILCSPRKR